MNDQPRTTAWTPLSGGDTSYRQTWKPLSLFNLYRLVIAGLFSLVAVIGIDLPPLGAEDHRLFMLTSIGYLLFGLLSALAIRWRTPRFQIQLYSQLPADIICITLLMYASGGVRSGLGK